jgi:hypothetical protein
VEVVGQIKKNFRPNIIHRICSSLRRLPGYKIHQRKTKLIVVFSLLEATSTSFIRLYFCIYVIRKQQEQKVGTNFNRFFSSLSKPSFFFVVTSKKCSSMWVSIRDESE